MTFSAISSGDNLLACSQRFVSYHWRKFNVLTSFFLVSHNFPYVELLDVKK